MSEKAGQRWAAGQKFGCHFGGAIGSNKVRTYVRDAHSVFIRTRELLELGVRACVCVFVSVSAAKLSTPPGVKILQTSAQVAPHRNLTQQFASFAVVRRRGRIVPNNPVLSNEWE